MTRSLTSRARAAASALTLALGIVWTAPPATAAELPTSPSPQPNRPSIAAATSAKLAQLDTSKAFQQAPAAATEGDSSGSFFRTPKGVAVLVLMAVGTGYAIYSAKSERINNPVR